MQPPLRTTVVSPERETHREGARKRGMCLRVRVPSRCGGSVPSCGGAQHSPRVMAMTECEAFASALCFVGACPPALWTRVGGGGGGCGQNRQRTKRGRASCIGRPRPNRTRHGLSVRCRLLTKRIRCGASRGGGARGPECTEAPAARPAGPASTTPRAYAQPLFPWRQAPTSTAFVTDSNRPQPLRQPPPTACLTAPGAASEVAETHG